MERLQKAIANSGYTSRRKAEDLIREGRVEVNGEVVSELGFKVKKGDIIMIDGKALEGENKVYYVFYKPKGCICTLSDELGRKTVIDYFEDVQERIYPVGRLDYDTTGVLLMSNDGEFANAMTHPTKHVPKTYRVTIRPTITEDQITALTTGIEIDGRMTMPSEVHVLEKKEGRVVLEIIIYEGRNRQIRKMCETLGLEVARLKRTQIGSVKLGMLKQGDWRHLTEDEVHKLTVAASMKERN